jgi:murein DD-endopeptidase MepM/ murein hydrolase activator NlpD
MARRLPLIVALALLAAGPAAAGDIGHRKQSVDARLAHVQQQLAASRRQAAALNAEVASVTRSIRRIELRVGDVSQRLSTLRRDLVLHRRRLAALDALLRVQTRRYRFRRHQYRLAVLRLDQRLVHIYEHPAPTTVDVLLAARSFSAVLDELRYLGAVAAQDERIASAVRASKLAVAAARRRTLAVRRSVRAETQVIRGRAQQVELLRAQLLTSRAQLARRRGMTRRALAATRREIQQEVGESQALQAASGELAARLRAQEQAAAGAGAAPGATTAGGSSATPAGAPRFIWPVSGPITSPFGMRWGTLHPGIDIGVPTGTPVHAAAAGTVVWCGWMSGYGNFVVIDHGGGYATAYGHNSRVVVSCGEHVAQGQVIAYSGCTGFCTGPHVHFEVRVNGTPVDPLAYLG